jgi:predicted dehydrogenase
MSQPIRVGIIGAGIGSQHLAAYLQLEQRFTVKYLCDIDADRARQVIDGNSNIEVTEYSAAVLADTSIDLVDICLPPHLHFDMCMKSLAARKHVVCEKPLVSSLQEIELLEQQAAEYQRLLSPVFQYRFGPAMSKLRALIDAGLTGKPYVANIETHWNRGPDYYSIPWRGTWKGEQGGAVLGHAIHNHDLLCAAFGPIKRVMALAGTRVNDIETEDCASISFEMQNGALATSSITLGAATDTTRLRFCFEHITATSGSLPYAPAEDEWTFEARGGAEQQARLDAFLATVQDGRSGFQGYFEALADTLEKQGTHAVTLSDGRRSIELVTAIYKSAKQKSIVSLPLLKSDEYYKGWIPAQ